MGNCDRINTAAPRDIDKKRAHIISGCIAGLSAAIALITDAHMPVRPTKHTLSLALSLFLMCAPAHAYEVETGPVLICDTQEQVERFVQAFDGNQGLAINTVNVEEHDPNACGVVNVTYVLGPQVGVARSQAHAFEITVVAVIGVITPNGYQPTKLSLYFTPVSLKEFAA